MSEVVNLLERRTFVYRDHTYNVTVGNTAFAWAVNLPGIGISSAVAPTRGLEKDLRLTHVKAKAAIDRLCLLKNGDRANEHIERNLDYPELHRPDQHRQDD